MLLAACGQPQSTAYPPQYEYNFMQACRAGANADSVCGCVWAKIAAEIPVRDFEAYERLSASERAANPMTVQLKAFSQTCMAGP